MSATCYRATTNTASLTTTCYQHVGRMCRHRWCSRDCPQLQPSQKRHSHVGIPPNIFARNFVAGLAAHMFDSLCGSKATPFTNGTHGLPIGRRRWNEALPGKCFRGWGRTRACATIVAGPPYVVLRKAPAVANSAINPQPLSNQHMISCCDSLTKMYHARALYDACMLRERGRLGHKPMALSPSRLFDCRDPLLSGIRHAAIEFHPLRHWSSAAQLVNRSSRSHTVSQRVADEFT